MAVWADSMAAYQYIDQLLCLGGRETGSVGGSQQAEVQEEEGEDVSHFEIRGDLMWAWIGQRFRWAIQWSVLVYNW